MDGLTEVEQRIADAFERGAELDLRSGDAALDDPANAAKWPADRVVRAAFLAGLLLGPATAAPGRVPALRLTGARVEGDFELDGGRVERRVRFIRCALTGPVKLGSARLRDVELIDCVLPALLAPGASVEGLLRLSGSRVEDAVELDDAQITGQLSLDGALLAGQSSDDGAAAARTDGAQTRALEAGDAARGNDAEVRRPVLSAERVRVGGQLRLNSGFTAHGSVTLVGARVGGDIDLRGARLHAPAAAALDLRQARAEGLDLRTAAPTEGTVDLRGAVVGVLDDDARTWPARLLLDGFCYDRLATPLRAAERQPWLERADGFRPQPFDQLARVYRALGSENDARSVLLERERRRHATLPWYARIWGALQDVTVGYGYRPIRAGAWAVGLMALGTAVFSLFRPTPSEHAGSTVFNPVFFTLDHFAPVLNLGQADAFTPTPGTQWFGYVLTLAGYLLATTIAAGVARSVTKL